VPPPGPASRDLARRLRRVESRNVTFLGDAFPVFWTEARGANVRDADGNVHLDLTAAFGVALAGHRPPAVTAALAAQGDRLVHGMGDVHPPEAKVAFLEALARLVPLPDPRIVLANSGSEAVEVALKTARLASGRPGIVAFQGGYHGLTVGALAATSRVEFRAPVAERLYPGVARLPFPETSPEGAGAPSRSVNSVLDALDRVLAEGVPAGQQGDAGDGGGGAGHGGSRHPVGTVIVEPVQARGGVRILPEAFARGLMERVRAHDLVLVADEIYTGMGRCGRVLASGRVGLEPDVVCLGKVLGGGMPLSACVASRRVMDAWPTSEGEALHTSTFLGHPLACAAGTAMVAEVAAGLPRRAETAGQRLMAHLCHALGDTPGVRLRGMGLLAGIEVRDPAGDPVPAAGVRVAEAVLRQGVLVLPAGDTGAVVELSPPAVLTEAQIEFGVGVVVDAVRREARGAR
jgi:4-aminobutyrate aminotransferase-like enzyme